VRSDTCAVMQRVPVAAGLHRPRLIAIWGLWFAHVFRVFSGERRTRVVVRPFRALSAVWRYSDAGGMGSIRLFAWIRFLELVSTRMRPTRSQTSRYHLFHLARSIVTAGRRGHPR
jgi:hypothetical protein